MILIINYKMKISFYNLINIIINTLIHFYLLILLISFFDILSYPPLYFPTYFAFVSLNLYLFLANLISLIFFLFLSLLSKNLVSLSCLDESY
jgi:hypothetical protein